MPSCFPWTQFAGYTFGPVALWKDALLSYSGLPGSGFWHGLQDSGSERGLTILPALHALNSVPFHSSPEEALCTLPPSFSGPVSTTRNSIASTRRSPKWRVQFLGIWV